MSDQEFRDLMQTATATRQAIDEKHKQIRKQLAALEKKMREG